MPTTGELEKNPTGSPSNPVPTDTGQQHSPDQHDYEYKKRQEKITRGAEQVEDRQSKEYWTSKEKERKAAERAERDAAALKMKSQKTPKQKKSKSKPGVEIPKPGMGRIGTAHKGLGRISAEGDSGGGYGGASAYTDPFAGINDLRGMGGFGGGGGGRGGSGMGFHVDIGSYADPFASLTPGKRGRKPKDTYTSPFGGMNIGLQRGRGRPPKSLLNLRLF